MPQTGNVAVVNRPLPTLVLSTSEDTYALTVDPTYRRVDVQVQFISDSAWLYSDTTGGPYFLIPANSAILVDVLGLSGKTLYVKAVAGTPTLYAMPVLK